MRTVSGECPNCICQLQISALRFGFRGTRIMFICPNCAILIPDESHNPRQGGTDIAKNPVRPVRTLLRETFDMMETLNTRVRHLITFVVAAVIIAAILRHTAHTYAGFSREEIRAGALIVCSIFFFALVIRRARERS
jgi:hypothetical protein